MIQVINGEITLEQLPLVHQLSTGEMVSNYLKLPKETLEEEGWLPLEDNPPEYDEETEELIDEGYEILKDKAIKKYKVVEKTIEINEQDILENYVLDVDYRLAMIEMGL